MGTKSKKTQFINAIDVEKSIKDKYDKKIDLGCTKYEGMRKRMSEAVQGVVDEFAKYLF